MAFCLKYFYCVGVCLSFLFPGSVSGEIDVEAVLKQLSLRFDDVLTETKVLKLKVDNIDNRVKNMEEKLQGIQATTPNSIDLMIAGEKQELYRELNGIIKMQAVTVGKMVFKEKQILRDSLTNFNAVFAELKSEIQTHMLASRVSLKETIKMQAVAVGKMVSREKKILRDSLTEFNAVYAELKSEIQTHMLAFNASLKKEINNIGTEFGNLKSNIQQEMSAYNKTLSNVLSITNATLEAKLEDVYEIVNDNSIMLTKGISELTSDWNSTTHNMTQILHAMERSMVSNIECQTHMLALNASLKEEINNIRTEYVNLKSEIQQEMPAYNKTLSDVLSITNATLEAKLEDVYEIVNNNSIMLTKGIAELTSVWNSTTHNMTQILQAMERFMVSNIELQTHMLALNASLKEEINNIRTEYDNLKTEIQQEMSAYNKTVSDVLSITNATLEAKLEDVYDIVNNNLIMLTKGIAELTSDWNLTTHNMTQILHAMERSMVSNIEFQTHMLALNASLKEEISNIRTEYDYQKSEIQQEISAYNKTLSDVFSINNATLEAKLEDVYEIVNNNSIMLKKGIAELTSDWNSTTHNMAQILQAMERSMVSNIEINTIRTEHDNLKSEINLTMSGYNTLEAKLEDVYETVSNNSIMLTKGITELTSDWNSTTHNMTHILQAMERSMVSNIEEIETRILSDFDKKQNSTQRTLISLQSSLNSLSSTMNSISYKQTYTIQPELTSLSSRIASVSSNVLSLSDRLSKEKDSTQSTLNSLSSTMNSISYKQTNTILPELTTLSSRITSVSSSLSSSVSSISDRLSKGKDSTQSALISLQNSLNSLSLNVSSISYKQTYTIQPELTALSSRIASVSSSLAFNVSSLSDRLSKEKAIDGGWSVWSAWSSCSETCPTSKTGKRTRQRQCNNPIPSGGGKSCEGSAYDTTHCNQQSYSEVKGTRAWQSSTWADCYAQYGIDDKLDGNFCQDNQPCGCRCAHTHSKNSAWVMEFQCPGTVKDVSVYFRSSFGYRNTAFTILVYDSFEDAINSSRGTACITYTGAGIVSKKTLTCLDPVYGKALRIQHFVNVDDGPNLQICEVEVFIG